MHTEWWLVFGAGLLLVTTDEGRGTYPFWQNLPPRFFHGHNLSDNLLMKIRPNVVNSTEVSRELILQLGHVMACDDIAKWCFFFPVFEKKKKKKQQEIQMWRMR